MYIILLKTLGVIITISAAFVILMTLLIVLLGIRRGKFSSFHEMTTFVRGLPGSQEDKRLRQFEAMRSVGYRVLLGSFVAAILLLGFQFLIGIL